MQEYIDREKAYDAVRYQELFDLKEGGCSRVILKLPAADVAPVVYGNWEPIRNADKETAGFIHTACGYACLTASKYCTNCGAKMSGKGGERECG